MYYGGDVAEIALAAVIALRWYAAGGRSLRRVQRGDPNMAAADARERTDT